ncbi:Hypothetical predicted protein [Octopus vulgaris]|uniref:Uncharacterized protein n=1 Tax=Octopus vulgaris TaxID=6645 RepID=A0AA36AIY1_OCTVU|nr:Hypothetical predicted protein [Octopus vulgaris]
MADMSSIVTVICDGYLSDICCQKSRRSVRLAETQHVSLTNTTLGSSHIYRIISGRQPVSSLHTNTVQRAGKTHVYKHTKTITHQVITLRSSETKTEITGKSSLSTEKRKYAAYHASRVSTSHGNIRIILEFMGKRIHIHKRLVFLL